MSYSLHLQNILNLLKKNDIINIIDNSKFHQYFLENISKYYNFDYIPMKSDIVYTNEIQLNFNNVIDKDLLILENVYSYENQMLLSEFKNKIIIYTKSDSDLKLEKYNFKDMDRVYRDLYTNSDTSTTEIIYTRENMTNIIDKLYSSELDGDILIYQNNPVMVQEILEWNIGKEINNSKNNNNKKINREIIFGNDGEWYDNIAFVCDDLKSLELAQTHTGSEKTEEEYISKYMAENRKNNAKYVYRFIDEKEYDGLDQNQKSEIETRSLHQLLLTNIINGKNSEILINSKNIDIKKKTIQLLDEFNKFEIIDMSFSKNISKNISERGLMLRKLPFGFRTSLLIILALENNYAVNECILFSCLLENYNTMDFTKIYKKIKKFLGKSDIETLMNIYVAYKKNLIRLDCSDCLDLKNYLKIVEQDVESICNILQINKKYNPEYNLEYLSNSNYIEIVYWDRKLLILPEYTIYPKYIDKDLDIYSISQESINTLLSKSPYNSIYNSYIWNLLWDISGYEKSVVISYISNNENNDLKADMIEMDEEEEEEEEEE